MTGGKHSNTPQPQVVNKELKHLGAFERMAFDVTAHPSKSMTGRGQERRRAKSSLERLLRAIDAAPAEPAKRKVKP